MKDFYIELSDDLCIEVEVDENLKRKNLSGKDTEEKSKHQDFVVLGKKFIGKNIEVTFNECGTFNIQYIQDGKTTILYENLNTFEDMADDGDEYDYAPLRGEKPIFSKNSKAILKLIENNDVRSVIETQIDFEIPEYLIEIDERTRVRSDKTIILKIKSQISIYKNSSVVHIKTDFENNAKSHRLRAIFPTGINSDFSYADDHFTIMKRDVEKPKDDGWFQLAQTIYHQDTFVDINNKDHGLSIFNMGLPEFEIVNYDDDGLKGNSIALTIVRGVEWLSQRGHLGRKSGLNGPNLPTPGAQCLRRFVVEYAVYPHEKNWEQGNCYQEAYSYCYPPKFFDKKQMRNLRTKLLKDLPADNSFIRIDNKNIVLTCVKKSEADLSKNTGVIVRMFNPRAKSQDVKVNINSKFKKVFKINMLESEENEIPLETDNKLKYIKIRIESDEIISIKLL